MIPIPFSEFNKSDSKIKEEKSIRGNLITGLETLF